MTVIPQRYDGDSKRERVEHMFDKIAPRYDLLNRVLSAGIDKGWRRKAIAELKNLQPQHMLDIATGTGDLAIEALKLNPESIIGIDISNGMLELGRQKIKQLNAEGIITLETGDSERMRFADNSFDAVTVAFGVRNFQNLEKGLAEIYRVLKPGGKAVILEFSQPQGLLIKPLYRFYSKTLMPFIGQMISKERSAYEYLPESVEAFPFGSRFTALMQQSGFKQTQLRELTFGIASIYTGIK